MTFLYADDTTMYCVGESVDQVTTTLNKALEELALLCKHNSLVPHPKKCEGMILKRNHFIGPLGSLKINQHLVKWSSSSKLLGVTIDNKLTWTKHISELRRGFVTKLNLIKRSRFFPGIRFDIYILKSFHPWLHMRYLFGVVVQIKMNLILWNPYIVGLLKLYITSRVTCPLRM